MKTHLINAVCQQALQLGLKWQSLCTRFLDSIITCLVPNNEDPLQPNKAVNCVKHTCTLPLLHIFLKLKTNNYCLPINSLDTQYFSILQYFLILFCPNETEVTT